MTKIVLFSVVGLAFFLGIQQPAGAGAPPAAPVKKNYIQQVTYGGDKGATIFTVRSEHAIQWAAHMIVFLVNRAHTEGKPLRTFYNDFIGEKESGLAKFRRDIAYETDTHAKDVFGVLRVNDTQHLLDYTPIRLSWHDDIADHFCTLLKHLEHAEADHIVHLKSNRSQNDLHVVSQDYCLDDKNIPMSRNILINHYKYDPNELTDEKVVKLAQHEAVSMDELFFGPPNADIKRDLRILQRQKNGLRILKYHMRLKIEDRMIPISVVYGLFQADQNKTNGVTQSHIDKLRNKSHFIVMHTTKDHVKTLMAAVEGYWEKAVTCQRTDVSCIKENLANLFYIQTHAMPYSRGSEAMTKWILEAVARYHGWTIVYPENYGFQLPFHSTIDDFVSDFVKRVMFVPYMARQPEGMPVPVAAITPAAPIAPVVPAA